ncbi:Squamosa promoter-binding protein 1 [Senna tora]|uniref:Squamosa promoter-binding protein 1 n=1 Tax=Senna tora TaxID=362788 RepID=A0A834TG85_9FABA|nr:Squamosa promoter-binding protein 1 [Senna tora]
MKVEPSSRTCCIADKNDVVCHTPSLPEPWRGIRTPSASDDTASHHSAPRAQLRVHFSAWQHRTPPEPFFPPT